MQIKPGMEGDDKSRQGFRKRQKHSLEGARVSRMYLLVHTGR